MLLVLLAILALFILEENIRGRVTLSRYQAELRAKGEKLTLVEMNLPKVPTEGNGAPALLEAANQLAPLTRTNQLWRSGLKMMRFVAPGCARVLYREEVPADWVAWPAHPLDRRQKRGGRQSYESEDYLTYSWDDLSEKIAAVSSILEKARTAARQPTLAVELDYANGLRGQSLHSMDVLYLRNWFAAAAIDALRKGNLEDALENIVTIAELTRLQKGERIVGAQQSRIWAASGGLRLTWEALQAGGWTDNQLVKLQESWQKADCLPDFVPSMEMARLLCVQAYSPDRLKKLLDGGELPYEIEYRRVDWADISAYILSRLGFGSFSAEGLQQRVGNSLNDRWYTTQLTMRFLIWRMAWLQQDEAIAIHGWQENLDGARVVAKQKSWAAWSVRSDRRWTFYDRWRRLQPGGSYDCDDQIQEAARYETMREMTVAAIVLKRYQLRTGKPPADLSALVPEFLPELPHDWMDGKPLCYRLKADGTFTLYSVGDNGRDDGGNPTPPVPTGSMSSIGEMWRGLDAVWPAPATREEIEAYESKIYGRKR